MPGKYVQRGSAQVGFATDGTPDVTYTLTGKGSNDWCNYTTGQYREILAHRARQQNCQRPTIQEAICGGQTQITGLASTSEAKQISTYLNYGALPVALHVTDSQQVAASLGSQYVDEATKAGIVGLIIVALFMILYYRLPGLLADIALLMYAATVFALFKLIGVTLTLAGIAGFILSIGMAVDANVLIFERMKEEMRAGKTLGAAIESGFKRAFPSIRDSNASTIITTVILFWFGHNFAASTITGFATTLFIGVVMSFVTAYFVSHTFLRLARTVGHRTRSLRSTASNHPGAGSRRRRHQLLNIVGKRYWYFLLSLIIIIPGTISLVTVHLKFGTDFTGGTEMTVQVNKAHQSNQIGAIISRVTGHPVDYTQEVLATKCPTDCQYIVRTKEVPQTGNQRDRAQPSRRHIRARRPWCSMPPPAGHRLAADTAGDHRGSSGRYRHPALHQLRFPKRAAIRSGLARPRSSPCCMTCWWCLASSRYSARCSTWRWMPRSSPPC